MKKLILVLIILSSFSAFASESVLYDCHYQDSVSSGTGVVSNAASVTLTEEGLSYNDLKIEIMDKNIEISHVVDQEIVNQKKISLSQSHFKFSSKIDKNEEEKSVYINCSVL